MGRPKLTYTSAVIAVVLCGVVLALESPTGSNPLGLGTVPVSAYKSGLIPSPNPIDSSGNLIVTGNVTGGMQFRGIVPYRGVTDFIAPDGTLGSTSGAFDSFLRMSVGSQDFERRSRGLTPYYSPSLSVTTTLPGTRGIVTSQAASGYGAESFSYVNLPRQVQPYQRGSISNLSNRPLSMTRQDLETMINQDIARYPMGGVPALPTDSQEQFWKQLRVPIETGRPVLGGEKSPDLAGTESAEKRGLLTGAEPNIGMLLNLGRQDRPGERPQEGLLPGLVPDSSVIQKPDVYEQMKMKLRQPALDLAVQGRIPETSVSDQTKETVGTAAGPADSNKSTTSIKPATPADLRVGAAASIKDVYKSFAAYTHDKFNYHIRAAENYMKQGRFYRAADAYTIATVYKPDDPLGYAGKSQALFAAGEYMSSALFLARAIEIFPDFAKVKVDIVSMIGDKDIIENRIIEAKEWRDRSRSAELEFLLSYVYYQMDRMEFARLAIESAAKKMPDSQVIATLKKAIDQRLANQ